MQQTFNFNIYSTDNNSEFNQFFYNITGLFFHVFKNVELCQDKLFVEGCLVKYKIDKTIYDYTVKDILAHYDALEIIRKEKQDRISEIDKTLKELQKKTKLTKSEKYQKKKLLNDLSFLKRTIDKGMCFGGKALLRKITKLSQRDNKTPKQYKILDKYKKGYKDQRERYVYLWGKACEGGNRKMDFHLEDGYVIFKPDRNTKIRINLIPFKSKKRNRIIKLLQQQIDLNQIAITVKLFKNKLCLSFDNEILNGFGFDTTECNNAIKNNPLRTRNEIRRQFHEKAKENKLSDKISTRLAAVDLNPSYIGFSISDIDPQTNQIKRVIFNQAYDISYYTENKNISTKERNKLNYEIVKIYDSIFEYCKHYRIGYFAIEELTKITTGVKSTKGKTFNRLTKNVWNREIQTSLIKIRCDEAGIIFNEIKPAYTSLIGNIKYDIFDPSAASVEIARRGYIKYIENAGRFFYPDFTTEDQKKVSYLLGREVDKNRSWVKIYKAIKELHPGNGGWWRNKPSTAGKALVNNKTHVILW